MIDFIKGQYKRSLFIGENGYIVGLFKVIDASDKYSYIKNKTITFTGYFHELIENDNYILYGNIVNHQKYGLQYSVEGYERVKPEDKDSIVDFLSSGLFKGIGEKTAKKIVDKFGKNTLDIIIKNKEKLLTVTGITSRQANNLYEKLIEYEASYDTILFLNELGFNTKDSMKIYNTYKIKTTDIVNTNIYKLCEIKDISYKKIDKIALLHNYAKDDERRITASILYVIEEVCFTNGDTYLFKQEIYDYTKRLLLMDISIETFDKSLKNLELDLKIVIESEKIYLQELYLAEENIAKRIKYLLNTKDNSIKKLDKYIEDLEVNSDIKYNDSQLEAIKKALIKKFLIITGGPGTGKTTIIKAIVNLYKDIHKLKYEKLTEEVALLAPTGRASKRITNASKHPASTIHRFLKWNKDTDKFSVNEYNKSKAKLVIIDEASMVDASLFNHLLKGISVDTSIIMVGDANQLPSVGPGQVLNDIINTNMPNIVKLDYLYRQEENSNIISLSYNINNGIINKDDFANDVSFINSDSYTLTEELKKVCKKYKDKDYNDFQVLVPFYKGINGINNLNTILQDIFNPRSTNKNEIKYGDVIYREKDKILQLTNMPDENVFNGDIGEIVSVSKKEILIDFDSNIVRYTPSNYINFKHGYAISIHKSQGSEFNTVVIPVVRDYSFMLYKKLYYTGVTRAKRKLYIVGDPSSLIKAVKNDKTNLRKTSLCDKLYKKLNVSHTTNGT